VNSVEKEMNPLAAYDEVRAKINEVKEQCDFIPDVSTDEGYEKSKRVSLDIGKILSSLEKTRKELKADALAYGRKVDAEAKSIEAELTEMRDPHKLAYQELDRMKKERETKRKQELQDRVDFISMLPSNMEDASSDEVQAALDDLLQEECLDFYEFTEQALKARNASRTALADMVNRKVKEEAERKEFERLKAEEAERKRIENEKRIADEARLEAEHAAQKAIEAEQEKAREAERKLEQEKERAALLHKKAEQEKAEAEQRAIEKQRLQEAEEARKIADKEHVASINRAAAQALIDAGLSSNDAKRAITAIVMNKVPNVKLTY